MPKTREELEAEWRETWWAEDYSWAGLANKPIAGDGGLHGEKTLQDYWRRDPVSGEVRDDAAMMAAGEVVVRPGTDDAPEHWHIAHLPLHWRNGDLAKAGWDPDDRKRLKDVIAARIATGAETQTRRKFSWMIEVIGIDSRAQFAGAVLLDQPHHPAGGGSPLHLVAAGARCPAWWSYGQVFGSCSDFSRALFADDVVLLKATFSSGTRFHSATFCGDAVFHSSFSDDADFFSVVVFGDARFDQTTFFGRARFHKASFSGDASFIRTTFSEEARFDNATFCGKADFSAGFCGNASFDSATFCGKADFGRASFSGDTSFVGASFATSASFARVQFEEARGSRPVQSGVLSFKQSLFSGPAIFMDAHFAVEPARHATAFHTTRFMDLADFTGCGTYWIAALDQASVYGRLLIDDPGERMALAEFDRTVLPAAVAAGDAVLKALEGGARTIKLAMGATHDERLEQRHRRFEFIARRRQAGTPRFEKAASWLYAKVADYGLSLTLPLIALAAWVGVFAGLYLGFGWLAAGRGPTPDAVGDALAMSLSRVFPFGAFDDTSKDWIKSVLTIGHCIDGCPCIVRESGWALGVRGLATVESLGAVILVFLFGLAVRRRFQIG